MEALLRELAATQQTQARAKLSERNVVELVFKLKALGILGDDLLHTINGKEFITTQRLKQEVLLALRQVRCMHARTHSDMHARTHACRLAGTHTSTQA